MHIESFAFYISVLRKHFVTYCSEKFVEQGVTYGQLFILIYIGKKKECSPKEISEFLKLDAGQLNRTLSKLVENGFVIQRKNSNDRRANIVSLTAKGKNVYETSHNIFYEWDKMILSQINDSSSQELMDLMKKMVCKLNEKMEENNMSQLNEFMNILTGNFNNSEQFETMKKNNKEFPYAEHVNSICNDKIVNLPADFNGIFMVEESYYTANGNTHATPHLFLFTEEEDGIKLTSYEMPSGYNKDTFTYQNLKEVDFNSLKLSEKFTPALYIEKNGVWEGGSTSMFSPVLKFTLFERFSKECLEVTETMEVNGKKTFGYDEPILYKRVL